MLTHSQGLKKLLQICIGALDENAPCTRDYNGPIAATVHPVMLGYPVHFIELCVGTGQNIEHHIHSSAELGGHLGHLFWHPGFGFVIHKLSFWTENPSCHHAIKFQKLI